MYNHNRSKTAPRVVVNGENNGNPTLTQEHKRREENKEEMGAQSLEYAIFAFYDSEKSYVNILTNVSNEQKRLTLIAKLGRNPILQEKDIHRIFGSIQNIAETSKSFLDNLTKLLVKGLRDKFGEEVELMVPFLKMYGDYVDDIKVNIQHLNKTNDKNKKFKEYLSIIKSLYGKTLESMLQEPIKRLPFYLQLLANIYAAYVERSEQSTQGGKCLYSALNAMKKIIDDIAQKTRDKKARMFCAVLQKNLFKNKVKLSEPFRMVYRTGKIKFLRNQGTKVEDGFLILCNDIILITTQPKRGAKLLGVLPTYNARVIKDIKIPQKTKIPKEGCDGRFALMCQNKAYNPPTDEFMYTIFFVRNTKQSEIWVHAIDSAIDEEEHNLHPTNPVDLMLRLTNKETSIEGSAPQLDIRDPHMIKQIQEWRKNRDKGVIGRRGFIARYAPEMETQSNQQILQRQNTAPLHSSDAPPLMSQSQSPQNSPQSNPKSQFRRIQTSPNIGRSQPKPNGPPPTVNLNGPPPIPNMPRSNNNGPPPPPNFNKSNGPPPIPNIKRGPPPTIGAPPPRKNPNGNRPKRNNLLGAIKGFDANKLKAPEGGRSRQKSVQEDMQDILKETLNGYRKFVMDEDDGSDDEGNDWMDE